MNHLIFIPAFYFIFVTTIICLIHTFIPDYPIFADYIYKSRISNNPPKKRLKTRRCAK